MASVAFLSDRLTLARCVRAVMTTETSWKIHVAQVVRISAPSNLQLRENVAVVDRKNSVTSLTNIFRSICVQIGVVLLIKANEPGRYFRGRLCACRIVCLQQLQALPLDVGQASPGYLRGRAPYPTLALASRRHASGDYDSPHIPCRIAEVPCPNLTRLRSDEGLDQSPSRYSVFHPRNGLPSCVGCRKTDMNSRTKVCTVNSRNPVSTDQHQKNGFRPCVCFVVGILAEYAQSYTTELLRPMAVLAGLSRRYETIAFQSGRNRSSGKCSVQSQSADEFRLSLLLIQPAAPGAT